LEGGSRGLLEGAIPVFTEEEPRKASARNETGTYRRMNELST